MTSGKRDWPIPTPLGSQKNIAWPKEVFPEPFSTFVEELSRFTETPLELAASMMMGTVATSIHSLFTVQVKEGYTEPTNLFLATALPPGSRKTSVQKACTKPLTKWEMDQDEIYRPKIEVIQSRNELIQMRVKEIKSKSSKDFDGDIDEVANEIRQLESMLESVPTVPRLWTSDVTPEHLSRLLACNHESLAVLSDEAGIFDIINGRYSGGAPNMDIFLQGHAGSSVRVDRGSKPSVTLKEPKITVALSPQPEVLRAIGQNSAFRGRGLLARFLYLMPESNLGKRNFNQESISSLVLENYDKAIHCLLNMRQGVGSGTEIKTLTLTSEAYQDWHSFALWVEGNLGEGGDFEYCRDWAGKLPGAVARIAGNLHVMCYFNSTPEEFSLSTHEMRKAILIGRVFASHATAVFEFMGSNPATMGAITILDLIRRKGWREFTRRDCHYSLKGRYHRSKELNLPLECLCDHGYIYRDEKKGKSEIYLVNPHVYGENPSRQPGDYEEE
jgi:hypothetical protein